MLSTFISLGVVTLLIRSAAGQDTCYTAHSVSDYALTGHAYKTTSGFRLMTCIVACDDDPNCYSLGYNIPSKTCELSRKTRRSDPASFSFRPNWLYLDHPVRPAGACVGDLPCKNRGRCQNVPHSPGYKCTCRQPYIGETCEVCSSPALGMEDKRIKDSRITSSTVGMWLQFFRPYYARLRGPTSWVCAYLDSSPWLKIELPLPVKLVTRIATQGNAKYDWWTTSYYLKTSIDGRQWEHRMEGGIEEVILGNTDSTSVATHDFLPPFKALSIIIEPLHKAGRAALRVELYGCDAID